MLTSAEQWVRPRPDRPQLVRDVALGVALALVSLVTVELLRSSRPDVDLGWRGVEGYLWAVAIVLPLCVRRRYPICVMVACAALFYVVGERLPGIVASLAVQAAPFIAIFTAWAWAPYRRRLRWTTVVVFTGMFVWLCVLLTERADSAAADSGGLLPAPVAVGVQMFMINILYFFGAMAWGLSAWRSARQRAELRQQAEELAAEQTARARRAVADERLRIARDLHDVVAHHVSSMGVHAAGARRMLDRDLGASREALRVIEGSSRQAVQEMQRIVSLLRSADGDPEAPASDRTPQPGLDDIPDLVERAGADGLSVTFRQTGTPVDVAPTVALSLYRTAQESLANLRKHADGARAEVVLRYLPEGEGGRAVEIEVIDDGAVTTAPAGSGEAAGWGLVGIRERASLHGGSTEIGPRPNGGYRVRVRMPTETSA